MSSALPTLAFLLVTSLHEHKSKVDCATYEDARNLRRDLFANYSKVERPVKNQDDVMTVIMSFRLLAIDQVDDLKQQLTVRCVLRSEWTDELLTWSPENYGGLRSVSSVQKDVWSPTIVALSMYDNHEVADWMTNDVLMHNGRVIFNAAGKFGTDCLLDMTYFPFDEQVCDISFMVEDYSIKEVILVNSSEEVIRHNRYKSNGQWEVVQTSYHYRRGGADGSEFSMLTVRLVLRRLYMFYVLNVLVPYVVISLLTLLDFLVPVGAGERASFALTALLAQVVFLNVLSVAMPKTSDELSLTVLLCLALLLLSTLAVVMSVLNIWLHDASVGPPHLVISVLAALLCVRRQPAEKDDRLAAGREKRGCSVCKDPSSSTAPSTQSSGRCSEAEWDVSPSASSSCLSGRCFGDATAVQKQKQREDPLSPTGSTPSTQLSGGRGTTGAEWMLSGGRCKGERDVVSPTVSSTHSREGCFGTDLDHDVAVLERQFLNKDFKDRLERKDVEYVPPMEHRHPFCYTEPSTQLSGRHRVAKKESTLALIESPVPHRDCEGRLVGKDTNDILPVTNSDGHILGLPAFKKGIPDFLKSKHDNKADENERGYLSRFVRHKSVRKVLKNVTFENHDATIEERNTHGNITNSLPVTHKTSHGQTDSLRRFCMYDSKHSGRQEDTPDKKDFILANEKDIVCKKLDVFCFRLFCILFFAVGITFFAMFAVARIN